MAPGVTGNEKKFKALVADFVRTTTDLGATIDPQGRRDRTAPAHPVHRHPYRRQPGHVLRSYLPDDWGQDMARQTYRQIQERDAHIDAVPDRQLPLPAVARLIAALGQALLLADVNNAATDPTCGFALTVFRDNLHRQRWSSCPCGQDCGRHQTDAAVLDALRADLLLLTETTAPPL